jgi:lipopolysaccharide transport system permease protein
VQFKITPVCGIGKNGIVLSFYAHRVSITGCAYTLTMDNEKEDWNLVVKPQSSVFDINLAELWRYRDLLMLFVKRDIVSVYKQTILGPLWFFIQPILTALTFSIIFGHMAGLSTDGKPPFLFYLAGITCWNYFAECLNSTSNTFINNAAIFGKVYFPRLISPLSIIISSLLRFLIQFTLFIGVYLYSYANGVVPAPNYLVIILPLLVLLMGLMGLALGIIISSFTTKYRDLRFLIGFGVQLMMYATPVILPLSEFKGSILYIVKYNPMTPIIETFKAAFLGMPASYDPMGLIYSAIFTLVFLTVSILIFNKVEKSFMDTV